MSQGQSSAAGCLLMVIGAVVFGSLLAVSGALDALIAVFEAMRP